MTERIALAQPLLMHAEEAASPSKPAESALLLYRAAGAWLDLDRPRAIILYQQAFAAAQQISLVRLRVDVEHDILSDLLPLSTSKTLELLPKAEAETRSVMYIAAVNNALAQGDTQGAVGAFLAASASGVFSERAASHALGMITATASKERLQVFQAAMDAYSRQTLAESHTWTASKVIALYGETIPAATTLTSIDMVLERAAERNQSGTFGSGQIGYGQNTIHYQSAYDLELFAVAPILRKLAPTKLSQLLATHAAVVEYLHRFPDGLESFDRNGYRPGRGLVGLYSPSYLPLGTASYATEKGAHSLALSSLDMGLEFTVALNLQQGLGVTGSLISYAAPGTPEAALLGKGNTCPPDVPHILASLDMVAITRKVPTECGGPDGAWCSYANEFPRANLLKNVAERCTYYLNKPAALSALYTQMELLPELPVPQRIDYLANAADLYLRLGERTLAAASVKAGFDVAATLFEQDEAAGNLKSLPKAVWPSAESYRRMVTLGVNADFDQARAGVGAIKDTELRELEQVMLARALLGIPVRRYMVYYGQGSRMKGHVEPGYEDF